MRHINRKPCLYSGRGRVRQSFQFLPLVSALIAGSAISAPSVDLPGGTTLDYSVTLSYTASQRLEKADSAYLNNSNQDDGTRNFDRGSLITNRLNALGEVSLTHENVGALVRGSIFYDAAYKGANDNDSPNTVNKYGPYNRFTSKAEDLSGQKARLLDAYVYGTWALEGEKYLTLNLGRHTRAWGEALFFPNISQGQVPLDATKFNVPGTEAKEGYLPVGQLSGSLTLTPDLTLTGYYQYKWEETQLNPVGNFFGSDVFGPGAEFYRFGANKINFAGEFKPKDSGQWGLGARYQLNEHTELGIFHYRYHSRVGSLLFDFTGDTQYSSFRSLGAGVPGTYKVAYFDDIELTGLSFSTKFGDAVQMGGDLSYRDNAPVSVDGGGVARGSYIQANVSALYTMGPSFVARQTTLMGEVMHQRINGVDTLIKTVGGVSTNLNDYVYDTATSEQTRDSTLLALGAVFDNPGIASGWDLNAKAILTQNISGSAVGGLGRHEKRLTLGADFKRLGNFTIGLTYAAYLSSANVREGRTMADRDFISVNIKQSF